MSFTPLFMPRQRGGYQRRAFTLARTLQMQGFALPPSSPGRRFLRLMPFFPSFSRSGFAGEPSRTSSLLSALRPAVSPLHLPLEVGLSCRHGVSRNSDDTGNGGFL